MQAVYHSLKEDPELVGFDAINRGHNLAEPVMLGKPPLSLDAVVAPCGLGEELLRHFPDFHLSEECSPATPLRPKKTISDKVKRLGICELSTTLSLNIPINILLRSRSRH